MFRQLLTRMGGPAVVAAVLLMAGPAAAQHHGGGGHGGGHSGGHHGHSGGHPGHHLDHVGGGLGGITGGSFTRGHFLNQNPCVPTDKTSADCPQLGGKPWQAIPAEKTQNRFEVEI